MSDVSALIDQVNSLCHSATVVDEESFRLTASGNALESHHVTVLLGIRHLARNLGLTPPTVLINGEAVDDDELADETSVGESWRLVIGKDVLASQLRIRETETTVLFFSVGGFESWLAGVDPFVKKSDHDPDFCGPTTFRVAGLAHAFGGPWLWILPATTLAIDNVASTALPEAAVVHALMHINADRLIRVCPKGWALTWGNLSQPMAARPCRLSAMVLSACVVQELKRSDGEIVATLRGTKLISLPLLNTTEGKDIAPFVPTLIEVVEWIYAERAETRLRLVTDRLSIDIQPGETLVLGMQKYLIEAFRQARDSYAFVILERKDAYHKEMRELMKDMKTQADLYAAKVRDLVSSLTRDILGVLVFLGFSFVGKFDESHLKDVLNSPELALLLKVFAGYLILSCSLQLITQRRDAVLSYRESQDWLRVLQHYTSRAEHEERFVTPLNLRKSALYRAMFIVAGLYGITAALVWNLPSVAALLLAK